jgi:hypothetical protein
MIRQRGSGRGLSLAVAVNTIITLKELTRRLAQLRQLGEVHRHSLFGQQLRQLGEVRCHPPRLVAGQPVGR